MQRNFEPIRKQVEAWQRSELTDVTAKVVIYEAFVEGRLEAPKHLARTVHDGDSAYACRISPAMEPSKTEFREDMELFYSGCGAKWPNVRTRWNEVVSKRRITL